MDKVSIIIPVFNAENTIIKCVESILSQTYPDIEVVIVNDGSTDKTAEICSKYTKNLEFVKFYTQENKGVSAARNLGIQKATGKYIQFVDADDYIESEMTEKLVSNMKNENDWVICGCYSNEGEKQSIIETSAKKQMNRKETLQALLEPDSIRGYLVNKLFNSNIIKEHNLRMKEHIFVCEDLIFCIDYAEYIGQTVYLQNPLYHYVYRNESATHKKYNSRKFSCIQAFESIKKNTEKYKDSLLDEKVEAHYLVLLIQLFVMLKRNYYSMKTEEMKQVMKKVKKRNVSLWNTNWQLKYKISSIPIKMLSILYK